MQALLQMENVCRYFTVRKGILGQAKKLHAVDGVSFELHKGETLGLVGESGCGKSTLGRLACGLLLPNSGKIIFAGRQLPSASSKSWAAGKIQMIFQDPASSLDPRMEVATSVAEPLLIKGMSIKERRHKADEMLDTVGLGGMGNRYPHQFSGGQRQRIAIARALITNPDMIVCDEPVSALDASVQAQVLNLLKDVQSQFQPAYLFISHALAVVGFMCTRIIVMYLGQIVEAASREELFTKASHPYTQALLSAMPQGSEYWAEGLGIDHLPLPLSGELPSPIDRPKGCYFHPRCPKVQEICRNTPPPWKILGKGWGCRCHFPTI